MFKRIDEAIEGNMYDTDESVRNAESRVTAITKEGYEIGFIKPNFSQDSLKDYVIWVKPLKPNLEGVIGKQDILNGLITFLNKAKEDSRFNMSFQGKSMSFIWSDGDVVVKGPQKSFVIEGNDTNNIVRRLTKF